MLLRDAGVAVDPADQRAVEVVATGLPVSHGIVATIFGITTGYKGLLGITRDYKGFLGISRDY